MFPCFRVSEALGKTEIDDVDVVLLFANTDQEVIRLYVSMQEVARVYEFYSLKLKTRIKGSRNRKIKYHLVSKHEHSLKGELALAVVEQVF